MPRAYSTQLHSELLTATLGVADSCSCSYTPSPPHPTAASSHPPYVLVTVACPQRLHQSVVRITKPVSPDEPHVLRAVGNDIYAM